MPARAGSGGDGGVAHVSIRMLLQSSSSIRYRGAQIRLTQDDTLDHARPMPPTRSCPSRVDPRPESTRGHGAARCEFCRQTAPDPFARSRHGDEPVSLAERDEFAGRLTVPERDPPSAASASALRGMRPVSGSMDGLVPDDELVGARSRLRSCRSQRVGRHDLQTCP